MKLYDKRLVDSKAKNWISYEISSGKEIYTIYNNILSMMWNMFWKRNKLISISIVDSVIVSDLNLLSAMQDNITMTYLETCLESEV